MLEELVELVEPSELLEEKTVIVELGESQPRTTI